HRDLPFVDYAWESGLDDATINSLFWTGANYYRPVDLPDTYRTELEARYPPVSGPNPEPAHRPIQSPDNPHPDSRATEQSPMGVTVQEIATEPEPIESDQVRGPATMPAMVDIPVGREGAEDSTTHCTAEVELPAYPELSACLYFPSTLLPSLCYLLLLALLPQSHHHCPLTALLLTLSPPICAVGSPRVCQSPTELWLEDPSSTPPASESWTPPRPSDPPAPPQLAAPSSPPLPVGPPAPPGFIFPPAPPWSVVVPPSPQDYTPPAATHRPVPPAPVGSSLPPALPQSSVTPAPLRTSRSLPPPWPSGSSVSPKIISSVSTYIMVITILQWNARSLIVNGQ
ncbi:hypothetical protein M9458_008773, partial [Cirrhinus mrigala]